MDALLDEVRKMHYNEVKKTKEPTPKPTEMKITPVQTTQTQMPEKMRKNDLQNYLKSKNIRFKVKDNMNTLRSLIP